MIIRKNLAINWRRTRPRSVVDKQKLRLALVLILIMPGNQNIAHGWVTTKTNCLLSDKRHKPLLPRCWRFQKQPRKTVSCVALGPSQLITPIIIRVTFSTDLKVTHATLSNSATSSTAIRYCLISLAQSSSSYYRAFTLVGTWEVVLHMPNVFISKRNLSAPEDIAASFANIHALTRSQVRHRATTANEFITEFRLEHVSSNLYYWIVLYYYSKRKVSVTTKANVRISSRFLIPYQWVSVYYTDVLPQLVTRKTHL